MAMDLGSGSGFGLEKFMDPDPARKIHGSESVQYQTGYATPLIQMLRIYKGSLFDKKNN